MIHIVTYNVVQLVYLYLCPVSQLPSSFCLLEEFQERVGLPKEILQMGMKVTHSWTKQNTSYY